MTRKVVTGSGGTAVHPRTSMNPKTLRERLRKARKRAEAAATGEVPPPPPPRDSAGKGGTNFVPLGGELADPAAEPGPAEPKPPPGPDNKSKLAQLITRRCGRGLKKGEILYDVAEHAGSFIAACSSELLNGQYASEMPAATEKLAEHAAARAAILIEFPDDDPDSLIAGQNAPGGLDGSRGGGRSWGKGKGDDQWAGAPLGLPPPPLPFGGWGSGGGSFEAWPGQGGCGKGGWDGGKGPAAKAGKGARSERKRKERPLHIAPGTGGPDDAKSRIMQALQLLIARPCQKGDLIYEATPLEPGNEHSQYVCALSLPTFDSTRMWEGVPGDTKKEAENNAAEAALIQLQDQIVVVQEEHRQKKQRQREQKLSERADKLQAEGRPLPPLGTLNTLG